MAMLTTDADSFSIVVQVENTGTRHGAKTVMAFVARTDYAGAPGHSLWSLKKVTLAPGGKTLLEFRASEVDPWCPFCTVEADGVRAVRAGSYEVRVGGDGGRGGACGGLVDEGACVVKRIVLSGEDQLRPL